jgi:purine-binding chemotaxis protein CheW
MDIAKIRKKLKKSGVVHQQPKDSGQTAKTSGDRCIEPEEKIPEPSPSQALDVGGQKELAVQRQTDMDIREGPESTAPEKIEDREEKRKPPVTNYKVESGNGKAEEIVEILTFRLMKEEFAFRISQLKEILRYQRITAVPNVPNYVLGITSLRGKVIPVIDLKLKLSLTDKPLNYGNSNTGKILIVKGPKGSIGATVDKIIGVIRIAKSEILPPPSHLSENELKFIEGIALVDKRFVSIINMEETVTLNLR